MRVCKQFTFDAAHMLSEHPGKCANLHGHTYKVEVIVYSEGYGAGKSGILIDFADLSKVVKSVIEPFDHAFIYEDIPGDDSVERKILNILVSAGKRVATVYGPPTAENMALFFKDRIKVKLPEGILVGSVKVWETPTAYAETGYGE